VAYTERSYTTWFHAMLKNDDPSSRRPLDIHI